ncbi:hypothetical protein QT970_02440 [Microcoleus sp. herbarium8]
MANFNVNPKTLQLSEWGEQYAKAMWLETWRLENQAKLFRNLFGGTE